MRRADAAIITSRLITELTQGISTVEPYKSARHRGVALELSAVMMLVMTATHDGNPLNASDIAKRLNFPRQTVVDRLRTLETSGRVYIVDRLYVANLELYDEIVTSEMIENWYRMLIEAAHSLALLRASLRDQKRRII